MIAFALVGGLALTACGSTGDAKATPFRALRTAARTPTTTSAPNAFVAATIHVPGSLRHLEGARSDVHDTSCTSHGGTWIARGRVTNSTSTSARYRIYVSFLLGDTAVGITEADRGPVAPKQTTDWHAGVRSTTLGLRCIMRVERAAA